MGGWNHEEEHSMKNEAFEAWLKKVLKPETLSTIQYEPAMKKLCHEAYCNYLRRH